MADMDEVSKVGIFREDEAVQLLYMQYSKKLGGREAPEYCVYDTDN